MKFLHLGDLHLGKTLGDYSLIEDQKYMLDQVMELMKERSVDALLIAGDVFDRSLPSEAAVNLLDDFLSHLADNEIETFIISGNHDSEERLAYGGRLFSSRGIHIAAGFRGELPKAVLRDEIGSINVFMLPFVKASQVRYYYPEETIDSYGDAVGTVIDHGNIDFGERNVILAHQFVSGEGAPRIAGSEGPSVQNVGQVEIISSDVFKGFDYAALGHLHSPQGVGGDQIRYSGSLLKYSLSEAGSHKSFPIIEIGEKGKVDIELVQLKPRRDLRHIKGRLDQLLQPDQITDADDYMYVTLTDEDIINDAMGIVQQYYPNTIKIDYENSHTRQIEAFEIDEIANDKSFPELISDFYLKMYGTGISEEELKVMMEVAGEAGVIDEAD